LATLPHPDRAIDPAINSGIDMRHVLDVFMVPLSLG
jgi:hypothetical protein